MLLLDGCEVVARSRKPFPDKGKLILGGRALLARRVGTLAPIEDIVVVVSETFRCATELDLNRRVVKLVRLKEKCAIAESTLFVAVKTQQWLVLSF